MAASRRRKIGHRRRVEDEVEDEGGVDASDDHDSLSDGSSLTDDHDPADDSDTSNVEDVSPTSATANKPARNGNVKAPASKPATARAAQVAKAISDTEAMLDHLSIADDQHSAEELDAGDAGTTADDISPSHPAAPIVVSSTIASRPVEGGGDRRRREHDEYKRRRDEDPSFVPNRGAFFMHDHRHAGPAANGFRPFPRATRGRGGRGGVGNTFLPVNSRLYGPPDPTVSNQWTHDMHEVAVEPNPRRVPQQHMPRGAAPVNGTGIIQTCPPNPTPINRTLSTEKHIANANIRVFFPPMKKAIVLPPLQVKQYTKLPDHRPPLRRDKPVRISLPDHPARFIFPASDRSFIFIPRAMRPNQQRVRGKATRSVVGSMGGFSRRTSVFGGSYYGSTYTPSIALSRRSSLAPDGRDYLMSPTGSVVSRPPLPADMSRPVVRLPPVAHHDAEANPTTANMYPYLADVPAPYAGVTPLSDLPPPQTHPLPQKPAFQENSRVNALPMHQPRPQKAVSVSDIESPTLSQHPPQNYQQPFHQQVPIQISNGLPPETHARRPSYPPQPTIGTPLSQIPERAIHAVPFQPNSFPQQNYYGSQPYPMMPPQQGFYYPPPYNGSGMPPSGPATPGFVPAAPGPQQTQGGGYGPTSAHEHQGGQSHTPAPGGGQNLIAQEVNGMVYYYDPSHMQQVNPYPPYSAPAGFVPGVVGMGGVVTPSPDGFYPYPSNMMYYQQ